MSKRESPIDVYKLIIDELVKDTPSLSSRLVLEKKIFSNAPDQKQANDLVRALTPGQRKTLAWMLNDERRGAIHDVLATLTWWLDCREVGLTYKGKPMPVQLSGEGLHGDYIGRLDDWEWPDED